MSGTILVAEDDPEARELLILLLGDGDYDVMEAQDGLEAFDALRRQTPDLLITDIVMPRMDGYELVRRIRSDERTASMPVIFCTASYHEREVREMARSLGVFNTLAKPYDLEVVRSVVASAIASRSPTVPPEPGPSEQTASHSRDAQERLNALATFSSRLFPEGDAGGIARRASRAAREIVLAQCAQVVVELDGDRAETSIESGLADSEVNQLLSSPTYRRLVAELEQGSSVVFPQLPAEELLGTFTPNAGEFVSMLGVPVASVARRYGYLCVINRIGLAAFTEEDLGIARAIAAQVAVAYENATRCEELESEIARRCAMENEVRRLNQELEGRVRERTVELERANRELEAFSYSVAHDLRAPLRLIDAQVQMLRSDRIGKLPRPIVVQLEQIQRGAEHMNALIDGLLTLSRVRHVEMERTSVVLGEIVAQAREILAAETASRAIEWRIGALPTVACDPDLMLQVFVNLIGNAIKYSRPRTPAIVEVGFEPGRQPNVFVRDNGVGFDMRYASKLFGLFQRLHRQDEFEGTGIGLATVSRIVERHGGRIWAESAVGQGAVFRFTLEPMGGGREGDTREGDTREGDRG